MTDWVWYDVGTSSGEVAEKVAESLVKLGSAHAQARNFEAAESPLQEALAIRRAAHGERDQRVAEASADLAVTYRNLGRTDEATVLMREALEIFRVDPGPDSTEYVNALASLAAAGRLFNDPGVHPWPCSRNLSRTGCAPASTTGSASSSSASSAACAAGS